MPVDFPKPLPRRPILAGNGVAAIGALQLALECWPREEIQVIAPAPGERHKWQECLATAARERGVTVVEPEAVNSAAMQELVRSHRSELLLSVYFTQLFSPEFLASIQGPAINFHPSLLPRHRGTAPLIWAIVDGDTRTGVTAHLIDEGVDTGPILMQYEIPIHPYDTGYSLHGKCAHLVAAMVARLLRGLGAGRGLPRAVAQTGEGTLHRRSDARLNAIRWTDPRDRIRNVIRALAPPLPGASMTIEGESFRILRAELASNDAPSREPGEMTVDGEEVRVWAVDGPLRIRIGAKL